MTAARTAASVAAAAGVAVYTYGWDTAFVVPVPEVNKAIVDHKSSPTGFSITKPTFTVTGSFGDWQICLGGDGKDVRMLLPLTNVTLTYTKTEKKISFNGSAIVEVQMHFIPHTGFEGMTGKPMALVVRDTASSRTAPAFFVVELTLSPVPHTVTGALIQEALNEWGNANLEQFKHVFAVVDLNRMVDQGQWGFVTPNYTSYAYLDAGTLAKSTFAVLTMTGSRTGEMLSEQVSEAAIPPDSVGGFVISQKRTLYDLVRPAIMQAYPGLTGENFLMNDDGTELYLTDGVSVDLQAVSHNGVWYHPKLTQLSVKSEGQILTLQSHTTTDIVAGITATCTATHWYELVLGESNNGQTLLFKESQTPDIVHDIHQSHGSTITQLIIDIVAAVALLILTLLTDGVALIVGGLIIALILGADQIIPSVIQKVNRDDSPSIDLLLVNAVDPIRWTASSDFKLDYASLNVSMQLGGDPGFA